jgi:hypothetical protein
METSSEENKHSRHSSARGQSSILCRVTRSWLPVHTPGYVQGIVKGLLHTTSHVCIKCKAPLERKRHVKLLAFLFYSNCLLGRALPLAMLLSCDGRSLYPHLQARRHCDLNGYLQPLDVVNRRFSLFQVLPSLIITPFFAASLIWLSKPRPPAFHFVISLIMHSALHSISQLLSGYILMSK